MGKGIAEEGLGKGQETGLNGEWQEWVDGEGLRLRATAGTKFDKAVAPGNAENVYLKAESVRAIRNW